MKLKVFLGLLLVGLLAMAGCSDITVDEQLNEISTQQVDKDENATLEDETVEEDQAEKEEVDSEKSTPAVVAPSGDKKPASTAKPAAPVKKTETSGTTAQVPVTLVKTIDGLSL